MEDIPTQQIYNLTHYQQRYNWDCGLSCIIMILGSAQRQELLQNFNKICEEEGFGLSTWTIDLCYVLQRFHVRHEYFTKTLGVDASYAQQSYYTKIIEKDEKRIQNRFDEAAMKGLQVQKRTVDMPWILRHLAKHGPVIVLTNSALLVCEICKREVLENVSCLTFLFKHKRTRKSYAGHYVVLCGYDLKKMQIYYRNPEVHDKHICFCSTSSMDKARQAYGTDEDIIFIFNH